MRRAISIMIATTAMAMAPATAQVRQRVPDRQIVLPPIGNFVPVHNQRVGRQSIVEFVPRGQSVRSYTKMVTLNTFPVALGTTADATLANFAQRYQAACRGTRVAVINLGAGNRGVRMDCSRNPRTGRPETVFARAVSMKPEMAIVQYMTTYVAMPGEAAYARDFLGRVAVR